MQHLKELSTYGNGRAVLNRYAYMGTLEEQPVLSFCDKNGVDLLFVEVLWEAFQSNTLPDAERLLAFDTTMILDYLEKTHIYYLDKLVPELELTLFNMVQIIGLSNPFTVELIQRFDAYRVELVEHIKDEEGQFFLYAKQLLGTSREHLNFSVDRFVSEHKHHEEDITSMIHFIKYHVEDIDLLTYKVFIGKLELLQRDLLIHAFVEDHVLVPKIKLLEG